MYGLPQTTEVKRPLPKVQLYKKFELKQAQRDAFDADISRLDFVNLIAPQTLPAISEGNEVKGIFVVDVELKRKDYNIKSIALIAKLIPQHIVFALHFEDKVQFAIYHTKLFVTDWYLISNASGLMPVSGLNLDAVWQNFVSAIGEMEITEGNSLTEQIRVDQEQSKIARQIEMLERQMRSTAQTRRQREIYSEIKKLKSLL